MKALKIILYIVGVIFLIYLIMAFIGPKNYKVERSKLINAPEEVIWNQVAYFKNWPAWSPWQEKDKGVKNTYEGEDGTKGAIMKWVGTPEISGTGQMEYTLVENNKMLEYSLSFIVPFESNSKGYFAFESAENNHTKLTWVDAGDFGFWTRPMMMFMNMDAMLGPDFERGLFKIDSLSRLAYSQQQQASSDTLSAMPADSTGASTGK